MSDADGGLYRSLNGTEVMCPISRQKFVPLDTLQRVVTPDAVQQYSDVPQRDVAEQIVRDASRVYAILAHCGRQDDINDLLSSGLADECLPLSRRRGSNDQVLKSDQPGGTLFETFQQWEPHQVTTFLEKQWLFQAPVFDEDGRHFVLSDDCALPILSQEERLARTEFSTVFQCTMCSSHYPREGHVS